MAARRAERPEVLARDRADTMYWVLVGTDESGSFPLLLTDEEALPGLRGSSVQWQLVATTRNQRVAARLLQAAHEECHGGGRRPEGPSRPPGASA
jgi:hypothetical protein